MKFEHSSNREGADFEPENALCLLDRHGFEFLLFIEPVAAQEVGQVLREGRTRHDHVASGIDGLSLEVALQVREEADNRGSLLELGAVAS